MNLTTNECLVARHLEARQLRRMKDDDRYLDRLERKEKAAETLVGELLREGQVVYCLNLKSANGTPNGRVKEFTGPGAYADAVDFLIRNRYV